MRLNLPIIFKAGFLILLIICSSSFAGEVIPLTLDSAVEIAISNSYRFKMLKMDIEKSILRLEARKAGLKTQVFMNLQTPDLKKISEYKWNSNLYRDEIVRQNTNRWQSDLAIEQPLILFGYPTNGYFSLNYRTYRYLQKDNGHDEIDYYNRLYLKFEQPFFTTNELKNDLEEAELNLKDVELDYYTECLEIMQNISDDYFEIFETQYENLIYEKQLTNLEKLKLNIIAKQQENVASQSEQTQVELEISNVRESLLNNQSYLRRQLADLKYRLSLSQGDSLVINSDIIIKPIVLDLKEVIQFSFENNPRLKRMDISKRESEIDVENAKSSNSFHMTLEMTYGIEKKDERLTHLWDNFDNSNSITLNAYLPIYDGGRRSKNVQAERIDLQQQQLRIEEEKEDIKKDITTAYTNLNDYYERLLNLTNSIRLAEQFTEESIEKYKNEEIILENLLQIIKRQQDIESNFLDVYIGYRNSILDLMEDTYYDYENNVSLLEKFDIKNGQKDSSRLKLGLGR